MLMYKFNAQLIAVGMIIGSLGKRPQAVCARTLLEQWLVISTSKY